ncbi:hypothetical protein [Nitrospira sp. Nam80]
MDYAVIEKLLRHQLNGMGKGYIHNWEHPLRDAVMRLETTIIEHSSSGTAK